VAPWHTALDRFPARECAQTVLVAEGAVVVVLVRIVGIARLRLESREAGVHCQREGRKREKRVEAEDGRAEPRDERLPSARCVQGLE
jgi:hypothetical protein